MEIELNYLWKITHIMWPLFGTSQSRPSDEENFHLRSLTLGFIELSYATSHNLLALFFFCYLHFGGKLVFFPNVV